MKDHKLVQVTPEHLHLLIQNAIDKNQDKKQSDHPGERAIWRCIEEVYATDELEMAAALVLVAGSRTVERTGELLQEMLQFTVRQAADGAFD
jgi:hypothetical protein